MNEDLGMFPPIMAKEPDCNSERVSRPTIKSGLNRQRYAELVQLGLRACEELDKHGLKREEYCDFGRIMDRLIQLK